MFSELAAMLVQYLGMCKKCGDIKHTDELTHDPRTRVGICDDCARRKSRKSRLSK